MTMKIYTAGIALPTVGSRPDLIEANDEGEALKKARNKHGSEKVLSVGIIEVDTPSGFF